MMPVTSIARPCPSKSTRAGLPRAAAFAILVLLVATDVFAQSIVGVLGIAAEIAPIERRLENSREVNVQGYVFRVGTLGGRQVVVGRSGAGKVNAAIVATLMISEFKPAVILFSGTAGAVDPSLQPGDVVIGATIAQHDVGMQLPDGIRRRGLRNAVTGSLDPLLVPAPESLLSVARRSAKELRLPAFRTVSGEERSPRIVEGVITTGDVFLADPGLRETLRTTLNASAIEMEGGAVVQTCRQFNVACLVIRSVTDGADPQALANYQAYLAIASEHAALVTAAIIAALE
jgi:adenosylhomocysteine nucleosidase